MNVKKFATMQSLSCKRFFIYLIASPSLLVVACTEQPHENEPSEFSVESFRFLEYYRDDLIEVAISGRNQDRLRGIDVLFEDDWGHKMDLSVGFYENSGEVKGVINNLSHEFRVIGSLKDAQFILHQIQTEDGLIFPCGEKKGVGERIDVENKHPNP